MPISSAYGCIYQDETYLNGISIGKNGPTPKISVRMDLSSPENHKRVRPSDLLSNPTSYQKYLVTQRWGQYGKIYTAGSIRKVTQDGSAGYFPYDQLVVHHPPEPPNVINRALVKLKEDRVNLGIMLGEYRRTAGLFAHVGSRLIYAYSKAKHGFITEAVKSLGQAAAPSKEGARRTTKKYGGKRYDGLRGGHSFSNAWLQYHFGVEQLVRDLKKAVDELSGKLKTLPDPILRASATSRSSQDQIYLVGGRTVSYYSVWKDKYTVVGWCDATELRELSNHGLTSPFALAWELLYLSWAVDYVVKVGEWLEALDVPMQFKRLVAWKSSSKRGTGVSLPFQPSNPAEKWTQMPKAEVHWRFTSRTVLAPSASPPRWKPSPSAIHIASITALAKQTLNNRR